MLINLASISTHVLVENGIGTTILWCPSLRKCRQPSVLSLLCIVEDQLHHRHQYLVLVVVLHHLINSHRSIFKINTLISNSLQVVVVMLLRLQMRDLLICHLLVNSSTHNQGLTIWVLYLIPYRCLQVYNLVDLLVLHLILKVCQLTNLLIILTQLLVILCLIDHRVSIRKVSMALSIIALLVDLMVDLTLLIYHLGILIQDSRVHHWLILVCRKLLICNLRLRWVNWGGRIVHHLLILPLLSNHQLYRGHNSKVSRSSINSSLWLMKTRSW